MIGSVAERVERAVAAIYPDIVERMAHQPALSADEPGLWYELSCCVLSSQVPFDLARAAAERIHQHGILCDAYSPTETESALRDILQGLFVVEGKMRKYRFPSSKSAQLSEIKNNVVRDFGSLSKAMSSFSNAEDLRRWLVLHAPGLGPKQASMLLRNTGTTYEMAILDRHILTYMHIIGILPTNEPANSYSKYQALEQKLKLHADALGYSLGHFDWAIWIVMRVLNRQEANRPIS